MVELIIRVKVYCVLSVDGIKSGPNESETRRRQEFKNSFFFGLALNSLVIDLISQKLFKLRCYWSFQLSTAVIGCEDSKM